MKDDRLWDQDYPQPEHHFDTHLMKDEYPSRTVDYFSRMFPSSEWCAINPCVRRDLIVFHLSNKGDQTMTTIPKNMPAPNVPHHDWLAGMALMDEPINMRQQRDAGGKDVRLFLVEGARRVTAALRDQIIDVVLTNIDDERVNCYQMNERAKQWWANGKEQGMTNEEILNGWQAMISLENDSKSGDAASAA